MADQGEHRDGRGESGRPVEYYVKTIRIPRNSGVPAGGRAGVSRRNFVLKVNVEDVMKRMLGIIVACALAGPASVPVLADQMQYYIWIDDEGEKHVADRPPENRDYETRTVEFDKGAGTPRGGALPASAPDSSANPPGSSDSSAGNDKIAAQQGGSENEKPKILPAEGMSGLGRAILIQQRTRAQPGPVPDPAGHTSPPGSGGQLDEVPAVPDISDLPELQEP